MPKGRFVVAEADAALDGGSIFLVVRDAGGQQHRIELVQSMFSASPNPERLTGRLYVDGQLVAVRSPQERALLEGLQQALSAPAELPECGEFVKDLVRFVESERYVELAKGGTRSS